MRQKSRMIQKLRRRQKLKRRQNYEGVKNQGEMSPKLKWHYNLNVAKTEMSPKLKCHLT